VAGRKVASSRRSDSRARETNSRRKKKEGRLEGETGRGKAFAPLPPPLFSRCTRNSLPTDRRAPLFERLEQARWKGTRSHSLISPAWIEIYDVNDLFVITNPYFPDQWADCSHAESWSDDWHLTQAWISVCCYCAALPERKTKKVCTFYLNFSFYTQVHCSQGAQSLTSELMTSMIVYCPHLLNLVSASRLWRISQGLEPIRNGEIVWMTNNNISYGLYYSSLPLL